MPNRPEWREAIEVLTEHSQVFQRALQSYAYRLQLTAEDSTEATSEGRKLWSFLRRHQSASDFRVAVRSLSTDGNDVNRTIAAAIVGSFADRDSAWWALADALRDTAGMVTSTARHVLWKLSRESARQVDWALAADILRYLLDGTNLFAHNTVMQVLAATEVAPALAPTLLGGGGELVLAKVRSEHEWSRRAAIEFLTVLSGHDFGDDTDAWEEWVRGL
jgi:hypothetical protein